MVFVKNRKNNNVSNVSRLVKDDFNYLLKVFMDHKKSQRLSDRTLSDYNDILTAFLDFVNGIEPSKIKSDDVKKYINFLTYEKINNKSKKPGLSTTRVNIVIRYLKVFFNFLYIEGFLKNHVMENIKEQKSLQEENRGIHYLEIEELQKILKRFDKSTFAGFRDYLLSSLIIDCGIRPGEALSLTLNNIDDDIITVPASIAKTRKTRKMKINPKLSKKINDYMKEHPEEWKNNLLFPSWNGGKLLVSSWGRRIKKAGQKAIKKDITPYMLRHSFAMHYIKNGGDVFSLQVIMGHEDISTTKIYINLAQNDIDNQHIKFSPFQDMETRNKRKKKR